MPVESGRLTVLILLLVGIGLSVTGELLLKQGMNRFREQFGVLDLSLATLIPTLVRVFTQPAVLLGFIFVFGASIFWLAVLSRVHLSFAYPLLAFGYVVTALLARLLFNEPISATRWTGIVVICLGVVLVART
ncbi:MAG: EamA family transporter [Thermomicrobiales bacterium]|jgi:multidrug transporter EmrE-like cation transporter|nr:EamA family transporter [Thermomicrobiales bacterium]